MNPVTQSHVEAVGLKECISSARFTQVKLFALDLSCKFLWLVQLITFVSIFYLLIHGPEFKWLENHSLGFEHWQTTELILELGISVVASYGTFKFLSSALKRRKITEVLHSQNESTLLNAKYHFTGEVFRVSTFSYICRYIGQKLSLFGFAIGRALRGTLNFNRGTIIAGASNHVRSEELSRLGFEASSQEFANHALRKGFKVSPVVPLPTSGICHGACRIFARDILRGENITDVTRRFEGGAPGEAAILQSHYGNLLDGGLIIRERSKPISHREAVRITARSANLQIVEKFSSKNADETISRLFQKDGVYQIGFKIENNRHGHGVLFGKRGNETFLFDINRNTRINIGPENIAELFTDYGRDPARRIHVERLSLRAG